eukprot:TRINITY_DN9413_c0_g1_i1.p1 TRINITY_DN9413_c0_g1~~TRINITY_DN9413_c0_g1_i1.p1  ORF type:complete len:852 (+),score=140.10 TRINITY_DN9413_c0_g1_i1:48-2558(+)
MPLSAEQLEKIAASRAAALERRAAAAKRRASDEDGLDADAGSNERLNKLACPEAASVGEQTTPERESMGPAMTPTTPASAAVDVLVPAGTSLAVSTPLAGLAHGAVGAAATATATNPITAPVVHLAASSPDLSSTVNIQDTIGSGNTFAPGSPSSSDDGTPADTDKVANATTHPQAQTTSAEGAFPSPAPSAPATDKTIMIADEREEFTGLRILNRTVPSDVWVKRISGCGRLVTPFSRLHQLAAVRRRPEDKDRVVIGVLYDKPKGEKFGNGEQYLCWALTDLGQPQPKKMKVHLRWQAFLHWRGGKAAASLTRGSIIALMNPTLVDEGGGGRAVGVDPVVRVEKAQQVLKVGDCPSMGLCEMSGCQEPCNLDVGDRFCMIHLSRFYLEKVPRIAAGGGVTTNGLVGVKTHGRAGRPQPKQMASPQQSLELLEAQLTPEEKKRRRELMKTAKSEVAMHFDERRLRSNGNNRSYMRAVCDGVELESHSSLSRVPKLGRGIKDDDVLEFDMHTIDTNEKRKAERLMQLLGKRREAERDEVVDEDMSLGLAGVDAPSMAKRLRIETPKQSQTSQSGNKDATAEKSKQEPLSLSKKSLGDLVKMMQGRQTSRRANPSRILSKNTVPKSQDVASTASIGDDVSGSIVASATAPADRAVEAASGGVTSGNPPNAHVDHAETTDQLVPSSEEELVTRAQNLQNDLVANSQNLEGIRAAIAAICDLPSEIYQLEAGTSLYEEVGTVSTLHTRPDARRLFSECRRRMRSMGARDRATLQAAAAVENAALYAQPSVATSASTGSPAADETAAASVQGAQSEMEERTSIAPTEEDPWAEAGLDRAE